MSVASCDRPSTAPLLGKGDLERNGSLAASDLSSFASLARHRRRRRRQIVASVVAALAVASLTYVWANRGRAERVSSRNSLVLYTVTRSDLPIVVTERGSLESQMNTEIRCEVETVGNQPGTRIVWIVPNGTAVHEGDRLVEFDSAPIKDRLDNQVVAFELARSAQIQATSKLDNQKAQNETAHAAAKLKVELADLNLKMYEDGEDGTYQISLQDLELKIQEAKNQIAEAQAGLVLQRTTRAGMEMLYKLGYRGKGDFDQAVYKSLQAEDGLVKATNALSNAIANKKKLEEFEYPMKKLELRGSLNTAHRGEQQVEIDNDALLLQTEATKIAADRALAKEEERLKRYRTQLEKCNITAPHDGMVAYSTERTPFGRFVGEGELVVERMKIMALPDLSSMQVRTMVHESVLDDVREGLPATVHVDASPDHVYQGTVASVGVLPAQMNSYSSDVKVYETVVTIDEAVEHLKPGMTAVVDIHVDHLESVLSVPVQAVVQVEEANTCYVRGPDGLERRTVTLGRTNDKFVQIVAGLHEGDQVVLNPMDVVDETEAR